MMRCFALLLVIPLIAACDDDTPDDTIVGDLGNGTFRYVCVGSGDPMCPDGGSASSFPDRVGVGGVFDLEFEPLDENDVDRTRIQSAATDIIDTRNEQFFANDLGVAALLAKRITDGRVLDLVHMTVVSVADIELDSGGSPPRRVYTVGRRERLSATAVDAQGSSVAGSREFDWSVSDERILRLELGNPAVDMELMPLRPGVATLSVTTGDVSASILVAVESSAFDGGGPPPDGAVPDAAPGDDGGADASRDGGATDAGAGGDVPDAADPADARAIQDAAGEGG